MEGKIQSLSISALDRDEWDASRRGRSTSRKRTLVPIGGTVGPRASLDALEGNKFLSLIGVEPRFLYGSVRSTVTVLGKVKEKIKNNDAAEDED